VGATIAAVAVGSAGGGAAVGDSGAGAGPPQLAASNAALTSRPIRIFAFFMVLSSSLKKDS
jgi:hypothetical protein